MIHACEKKIPLFHSVAAAGMTEVQPVVHLAPGGPVGRKAICAEGIGKKGRLPHQNGAEHALVISHIDLFEQTGFDLEDFGDDSIVIRAMPDDIMGVDPQALFDALLNALSTDAGTINIDFFVEKLSGMACKAAIKGNTEISLQEADALIDELLTLKNPYNCPHGRPTMISLTKTELERKFKRIQN